MRENINHYEVLGLNASGKNESGNPYTPKEIKSAYNKRSLACHPDKQKNKTPEEIEKAKQRFIQLSASFEILNDSHKRNEFYQDLQNNPKKYRSLKKEHLFTKTNTKEPLDLTQIFKNLGDQELILKQAKLNKAFSLAVVQNDSLFNLLNEDKQSELWIIAYNQHGNHCESYENFKHFLESIEKWQSSELHPIITALMRMHHDGNIAQALNFLEKHPSLLEKHSYESLFLLSSKFLNAAEYIVERFHKQLSTSEYLQLLNYHPDEKDLLLIKLLENEKQQLTTIIQLRSELVRKNNDIFETNREEIIALGLSAFYIIDQLDNFNVYSFLLINIVLETIEFKEFEFAYNNQTDYLKNIIKSAFTNYILINLASLSLYPDFALWSLKNSLLSNGNIKLFSKQLSSLQFKVLFNDDLSFVLNPHKFVQLSSEILELSFKNIYELFDNSKAEHFLDQLLHLIEDPSLDNYIHDNLFYIQMAFSKEEVVNLILENDSTIKARYQPVVKEIVFFLHRNKIINFFVCQKLREFSSKVITSYQFLEEWDKHSKRGPNLQPLSYPVFMEHFNITGYFFNLGFLENVDADTQFNILMSIPKTEFSYLHSSCIIRAIYQCSDDQVSFLLQYIPKTTLSYVTHRELILGEYFNNYQKYNPEIVYSLDRILKNPTWANQLLVGPDLDRWLKYSIQTTILKEFPDLQNNINNFPKKTLFDEFCIDLNNPLAISNQVFYDYINKTGLTWDFHRRIVNAIEKHPEAKRAYSEALVRLIDDNCIIFPELLQTTQRYIEKMRSDTSFKKPNLPEEGTEPRIVDSRQEKAKFEERQEEILVSIFEALSQTTEFVERISDNTLSQALMNEFMVFAKDHHSFKQSIDYVRIDELIKKLLQSDLESQPQLRILFDTLNNLQTNHIIILLLLLKEHGFLNLEPLIDEFVKKIDASTEPEILIQLIQEIHFHFEEPRSGAITTILNKMQRIRSEVINTQLITEFNNLMISLLNSSKVDTLDTDHNLQAFIVKLLAFDSPSEELQVLKTHLHPLSTNDPVILLIRLRDAGISFANTCIQRFIDLSKDSSGNHAIFTHLFSMFSKETNVITEEWIEFDLKLSQAHKKLPIKESTQLLSEFAVISLGILNSNKILKLSDEARIRSFINKLNEIDLIIDPELKLIKDQLAKCADNTIFDFLATIRVTNSHFVDRVLIEYCRQSTSSDILNPEISKHLLRLIKYFNNSELAMEFFKSKHFSMSRNECMSLFGKHSFNSFMELILSPNDLKAASDACSIDSFKKYFDQEKPFNQALLFFKSLANDENIAPKKLQLFPLYNEHILTLNQLIEIDTESTTFYMLSELQNHLAVTPPKEKNDVIKEFIASTYFKKLERQVFTPIAIQIARLERDNPQKAIHLKSEKRTLYKIIADSVAEDSKHISYRDVNLKIQEQFAALAADHRFSTPSGHLHRFFKSVVDFFTPKQYQNRFFTTKTTNALVDIKRELSLNLTR